MTLLMRHRRLPWFTGLAAVVMIAVLARPSALVTFSLIALAGTINSKRSTR
ncbi:MAG: hypothetical protein ACON4T_00595 [Synechococcus sp.]